MGCVAFTVAFARKSATNVGGASLSSERTRRSPSALMYAPNHTKSDSSYRLNCALYSLEGFSLSAVTRRSDMQCDRERNAGVTNLYVAPPTIRTLERWIASAVGMRGALSLSLLSRGLEGLVESRCLRRGSGCTFPPACSCASELASTWPSLSLEAPSCEPSESSPSCEPFSSCDPVSLLPCSSLSLLPVAVASCARVYPSTSDSWVAPASTSAYSTRSVSAPVVLVATVEGFMLLTLASHTHASP
mmetsp:Transcript_51223/g.128528  ORF Transcript_51223/g.128528 Transcript_51223/m.128528 type:complete len:246 (+) Transcript_51223:370-1107(+)